MTADHPIAQAVGIEAATRLAAVFGGQRKELPTERNLRRGQRDAEIRAGLAAGRTTVELGLDSGLTRQRVGQIGREQSPKRFADMASSQASGQSHESTSGVPACESLD
jgi:hypothetical protein